MPADVDQLGRAERLGRGGAGTEEREGLVEDPLGQAVVEIRVLGGDTAPGWPPS